MDQSEEKQPTHFGQWSKNSEDVLKTHFPLHRCCRDGDVDTLSLLLMKAQHGIYSEDCFYGWTPVHWAAYFGKLGCLRKLMSVTRIGVDCDILTAKFRQTPCHVAAYGGHPYSLQWLLQSDANKDAQDYLGETPLHKAARTGSIECISLLISHGADVRVENNHKQTACDLAQSCGYLECCQFLTAAMSQNGTSVDRMKLLPPRESMERIAAGLNGGLVPPMSPTISSNGHSQDCDMDTVDASPIVNGCHKSLFQTENQRNGSVMVSNGHTPVQGSYGFLPRNGGHAMNGAGDYLRNVHATAAPSNGDILLADGVRCNSVPVAGRKRSREDDEQTEYKRLRTADYDEGMDVVSNDGCRLPTNNNTMSSSSCSSYSCIGGVDLATQTRSPFKYSQAPPIKCMALFGHYI
ncbi:uncharacterized protein LOC141905187 isoform X2 [Tubulanus polymorphus]|uniref:uncharacterized protein LOC141905187 isoform X2 n=1 Tax=Tubulanus polymorphus TaxID=672921 RepID=UPI003DA5D606